MILRLLPLLVLVAAPFAQEPTIAPDDAVQRGLERLLATDTPATRRAALDFLRESAGPRHARLVPQLVLWLERSTDTDTGMLPGLVRAELAIPDEDFVAALVPLLASDDAPRRAQLARLLSEFEDHDLERGADFSLYRPYLEREPAPGLVRHLFGADPDAALRELVRAQVREPAERRALELAQHELADLRWRVRRGYLARATLERDAPAAVTALGELAQSPRAWARLAAATLASEEPALHAAARLELLSDDPDALVRATARAARERR